MYAERQRSCNTFSFDIFWIKIDDLRNQCSLVFMPVEKTRRKNKGYRKFGEKCKIVTLGHKIFPKKMFSYQLQFTCYLYDVVNWKNKSPSNFLRTAEFNAILKKLQCQKNVSLILKIGLTFNLTQRQMHFKVN